MDLDWTQQSAAGVTLVTARLHNGRASDRRVRLGNRLDGPVLPPRRNGTPETGWDDEGLTTVVPAGGTVVVGYACPAPQSAPPVGVEAVGAPEDGPETSARTAIRELGDHRPPRDVLGGADRREAAEADGSNTETELLASDGWEPEAAGPNSAATDPMSAVETDLAAFRTRIETAEALGGAGVPAATALLDSVGGVDGVERLAAKLDSDARELRELAAAASTLADRAEAAAPPVDALRRLS